MNALFVKFCGCFEITRPACLFCFLDQDTTPGDPCCLCRSSHDFRDRRMRNFPVTLLRRSNDKMAFRDKLLN